MNRWLLAAIAAQQNIKKPLSYVDNELRVFGDTFTTTDGTFKSWLRRYDSEEGEHYFKAESICSVTEDTDGKRISAYVPSDLPSSTVPVGAFLTKPLNVTYFNSLIITYKSAKVSDGPSVIYGLLHNLPVDYQNGFITDSDMVVYTTGPYTGSNGALSSLQTATLDVSSLTGNYYFYFGQNNYIRQLINSKTLYTLTLKK